MGAVEDAAEAARLPQGPRAGSSTTIWKTAQLLSIDATAQRAWVSIDGSQPVGLPYAPGVYTGFTTVAALCNPLEGGRAVYVLGPVGVQVVANPDPAAPADPPPPPPPPPPAAVTATATILPTWSGTWSSKWSKWGGWTNGGRYGGALSLYQGDAYGSGSLKGLAVYGDQIANLGALSIVSAIVTVTVATGSGSPTVQGSASGTPYPAGPPVSSGAVSSGTGPVVLDPSVCEALRTGATKGLALVGTGYCAVYGEGRADGMALHIEYLRAG
jgi:hypothetical protein